MAAANPVSAPAASSIQMPPSAQALYEAHPPVAYGGANLANMTGYLSVSNAALATAPAVLSAPPIFLTVGMAASGAAQPDGAVPAYAGDLLDDFGNVDWMDFTGLTFCRVFDTPGVALCLSLC